jgi:hypothetical protein
MVTNPRISAARELCLKRLTAARRLREINSRTPYPRTKPMNTSETYSAIDTPIPGSIGRILLLRFGLIKLVDGDKFARTRELRVS